MQLTGFQGKVALVTGAAGGIGQAVVAGLLAAGAKVVATDRAEAFAPLPPDHVNLIWRVFDVARDDPDALLAGARSHFGPVTLGVHAAGILSQVPLLETSLDEWNRVLEINAGGTFRVTTALGRAMRDAIPDGGQGGAIVVVSSNAAGIPRLGMGAYAASKAAATMMTRCLGLELAAHGIRCNIVAPGSTLTPMQTGMWSGPEGQQKVIDGDLASYRTGIPLRKLATPEDIAGAVLYLLSDQAGQVTMADLYVDGGATLRG